MCLLGPGGTGRRATPARRDVRTLCSGNSLGTPKQGRMPYRGSGSGNSGGPARAWQEWAAPKSVSLLVNQWRTSGTSKNTWERTFQGTGILCNVRESQNLGIKANVTLFLRRTCWSLGSICNRIWYLIMSLINSCPVIHHKLSLYRILRLARALRMQSHDVLCVS